MEYQIRLASAADTVDLAVLKQRVWAETYRGIYSDSDLDQFAYDKAEQAFGKAVESGTASLYVVESGERLVGYMQVGVPRRPFRDYEQEISLLYLTKDFQKRGIGRELFELGYQEIKGKGVLQFFISCNKYNENARRFYEKMGGALIWEDPDSPEKRDVQAKYHFEITEK